MFEVVHFVHKWSSPTEVQSEVLYGGQKIATTVVDVDSGRISPLSGGFGSVPANSRLQEHLNKRHDELLLDGVKGSAMGWATRNRT